MTKENQKEIFRWLLLFCGLVLVFTTLILYLKGNNENESFLIINFYCLILFGSAFLGIIISLLFCEAEDDNIDLKNQFKLENIISNYKNEIVIIRKSKQYLKIFHFATIEEAFKIMKNNDVLYVLDSEFAINKTMINNLFYNCKNINTITIKMIQREEINTFYLIRDY